MRLASKDGSNVNEPKGEIIPKPTQGGNRNVTQRQEKGGRNNGRRGGVHTPNVDSSPTNKQPKSKPNGTSSTRTSNNRSGRGSQSRGKAEASDRGPGKPAARQHSDGRHNVVDRQGGVSRQLSGDNQPDNSTPHKRNESGTRFATRGNRKDSHQEDRPSKGSNQEGNIGNDTVIALLGKTWNELIRDLCPEFLLFHNQFVKDFGITGTIVLYNELAGNLLKHETPTQIELWDAYRFLCMQPIGSALQILRFGKRFTPQSWTEGQETDLINDFLMRNAQGKVFHEYPTWLRKLCEPIGEQIFSAALKGKPFSSLLYERTFERDIRNLPHGTTAEGLRNPFEKYLYVRCAHKLVDAHLLLGATVYSQDDDIDQLPSKLVTVPKDIRGPRIIMEEPLERTLRQSVLADGLHKVIMTPSFSKFAPNKAIHLDDQGWNQESALIGSETGYYATLDLSAASDSITASLLHLTLPYDVANEILRNCSKRFLLPTGERRRLYLPCTMGSRVTVPAQSLVYWVLVCAAAQLAHDFNTEGALDMLTDCRVYNDDIIVPEQLVPFVLAIFEKAGLVVNHDKSFSGDSPFRESCGLDAYDGEIVTSIYWPRKVIFPDSESLTTLCSLQNRLYSAGYTKAAQVIAKFIVSVEPRIPRIWPEDDVVGIYSHQRSYSVAPYMESVKVPITIYFDVTVVNSVMLMTRVKSSSDDHVYPVTTYGDIRSLLRKYHPETLYIFGCDGGAWHNIPYSLRPNKTVSYDDVLAALAAYDSVPFVSGYRYERMESETFVQATVPTIQQGFSNHLFNAQFLDHSIWNKAILDAFVEEWELDSYYLNGPEYYDDTCELLGVSQPSRRRKRLVPDGYRIRNVKFVTGRLAISHSDMR